MKDFGNMLLQGNMYTLDNYSVKPFTGKNRCFEMDNHIILLKCYVITKVDDPYTIVPPDICMFANLKNIDELGKKDAALIGIILIYINFTRTCKNVTSIQEYFTYICLSWIDVVGIISSVKQMKNVTTHNLEGKSYVDFKITDYM